MSEKNCGLATHWIIATSRTRECPAGRRYQPEKSCERCPSQTSIDGSDHLLMNTEGNGNDSVLQSRKALLSPIKELNELEVLERHKSLDGDSGSSCAEATKTVADPTFQDPWYPTTIASLGVCPNEAALPMHRQFGPYPPLSCQHFPLVNVLLTFP